MASSESNNNNTTELKMAEKEEESKLKAKYPSIQRPGPQFLQKRLQKGQKFFDSGDYFASGKNSTLATDQQQNKNLYSLKPRLNPQPHSNLAGMKKEDKEEYVTENILAGKDSPIVPATNTGDAIPTPDCLATRKASIHVPSKLVSGGP